MQRIAFLQKEEQQCRSGINEINKIEITKCPYMGHFFVHVMWIIVFEI